MPTHIAYLDESGDLGWTFDQPFRHGGSSRYLTISHLTIPHGKEHSPKRIVRKVYQHFSFNPKVEMKGSMLSDTQLEYAAYKVRDYIKTGMGYLLGSITVRKQNVMPHIQQDGNKIYNYMIRLSLMPQITSCGELCLIRDNRTIKVKSGSSLSDYLKIVLWFEYKTKTQLIDQPEESHTNPNLIFIDWVAHMIWSKYEDKNPKYFDIIGKHLNNIELFF